MRRPVAWLAALLGGWAVAVLQPVLGPLGGSPEFFVAHRADPLDILILTAVLALAFPLLLWGLALAGLLAGRRVGVVVAATAIGLVTAPAALEAAYSAGITGWPASIAVALSAAALVAAAWHRVSPVRTFLALLAPAILIVPVLFLLAPGMRSLLWNAATAEPGAHAASPAPVVVVVFDEMSLTSLLGRDGALDAGRYPHLTALARDGTWYRHATTVSDFTQWALPAILTGRYPRPDTTPTARDHPRSVFTALSADYRLEVREPVTAVCPQTLCGPGTDTRTARMGSELRDVRVVAAYVFLPPAARQWLPSLTQGWANFDAASDADGSDRPGGLPADRDAQVGLERIRQVRAFVDGISREDGQPTLYFLHTLISHHPPRWLPSGQVIAEREDVPAPLQNGRWPQDAVAVAEHFQGHLLQAELADTVVGWLVDRLVQQEMYDRALVVVTADHGASFRPGDAMRDLTDTNAGDIVPVPLIVKLPGQRMAQAVDDRRAQTVDILPTIADAIDLELPFEPDGRSLLTSAAADREVRVYRAKATRMVTYSPDALTALQRAALDRQEGLFGDRRWPALLVPGVPDSDRPRRPGSRAGRQRHWLGRASGPAARAREREPVGGRIAGPGDRHPRALARRRHGAVRPRGCRQRPDRRHDRARQRHHALVRHDSAVEPGERRQPPAGVSARSPPRRAAGAIASGAGPRVLTGEPRARAGPGGRDTPARPVRHRVG